MKALTTIQGDIAPGGAKTGTADRAKQLVVASAAVVDLSGSTIGTSGQVLTSNGNNTASFQSLPTPDQNPVFWMF